MASQYYTIEQVSDALGISADEVKVMAAEGKLREIRDAGKIYYRVDEVERMRAKEGSSIVDLAAADAGAEDNATFAEALSSLADSSSDLGLLDDGTKTGKDEMGDIPEQLPSAPAGSIMDDFSSEISLMPMEDEKAGKGGAAAAHAVPDLGLSGSDVIKLETAEEMPAKKPKEDTRITSAGISVFDDEELDIEADPMGKTHIAPAVEDFDAAGGGSGLLDLPRESDDTSLGAELLDVISPTEADTEDATAVTETVVEEVAVGDDLEPAFVTTTTSVAVRRAPVMTAGAAQVNVCAILGLLGLAMAGLATAAGLQGIWLSFLTPLASGAVFMAVFITLIVVAAAMGIWSILADRNR